MNSKRTKIEKINLEQLKTTAPKSSLSPAWRTTCRSERTKEGWAWASSALWEGKTRIYPTACRFKRKNSTTGSILTVLRRPLKWWENNISQLPFRGLTKIKISIISAITSSMTRSSPLPRSSISDTQVMLNFTRPPTEETMTCKIKIEAITSQIQTKFWSLCSTAPNRTLRWIKINSMSIKINKLISTTTLSQSLTWFKKTQTWLISNSFKTNHFQQHTPKEPR